MKIVILFDSCPFRKWISLKEGGGGGEMIHKFYLRKYQMNLLGL